MSTMDEKAMLLEASARETLNRLPVADAALSLWAHVLGPRLMAQIFAEDRGRRFEDTLTFARFVELIGNALVTPEGSGRQSCARAQEQGLLPASSEAVYGKLRRVPLSLSRGFMTEGTARVGAVRPPQPVATAFPASMTERTVVGGEGKILKRVAKRLLPARGAAGKVDGGKVLVAFLPQEGSVVAMAADSDGERNEWRIGPQGVEQTRAVVSGPRLWGRDRQCCDLVQTGRCREDGVHFLIWDHPKGHFHQDWLQAAQETPDPQGRSIREDWGWIGAATNAQRRYVRRLTFWRPGEETILRLTDRLDARRSPAAELLAVYLTRWGIERVFQQITEGLALRRLIGSPPQATVFQAAFCRLLYNRGQVLRGSVAAAPPPLEVAEEVSAEQLFYDGQRELPTGSVLGPPAILAGAYVEALSSETLRQRLPDLFAPLWTPRWRKAVNLKPRPKVAKAKQSGAPTSMPRLLVAARQDPRPQRAAA